MTDNLTPSLFDIAEPGFESVENMFEDGDCGIIVKSDGSFRGFALGIDLERLADPTNYSDKERRWVEKGEILMALCLALANQRVMNVLLDLTRNLVDPKEFENGTAK